jgi:hypothetical protein
MTDRERAIDRVRKSLAQAASAEAIGSLNEAEAFAAFAQKIMIAHKLSLSDLDSKTDDANIGDEYFNVAVVLDWKKSDKGREMWLQRLTSGICRANFCKMWYVPGSKTVKIIGRDTDREVVKYMLTVLAREAERLAVLHERKARLSAMRAGQPMPVQPKKSFLLGFADAIYTKLTFVMEEATRAATGTALVRLNNQIAPVNQWIEQNLGKGVKGSALNRGQIDASSYRAGKTAGQNASTSKGVGTHKDGTVGGLLR